MKNCTGAAERINAGVRPPRARLQDETLGQRTLHDTHVGVRGGDAAAAQQLAAKKNKRQSNHHRGTRITNVALKAAEKTLDPRTGGRGTQGTDQTRGEWLDVWSMGVGEWAPYGTHVSVAVQ